MKRPTLQLAEIADELERPAIRSTTKRPSLPPPISCSGQWIDAIALAMEHVRDAALGIADPDARVLAMLGARGKNLAKPRGPKTKTQPGSAA